MLHQLWVLHFCFVNAINTTEMTKPFPILFSLLLPVVADAGSFKYHHVQTTEQGSDYFKYSRQSVLPKQGTIVLTRKAMVIDNQEFKLKPTRNRWRYRIRGGLVRLEYQAGKLVAVRVHKYNQSFRYCIHEAPSHRTN